MHPGRMSVYHLHARAVEGPLDALRRDEVRTAQTDDAAEAESWARAQLRDGFTVWIYDHGHGPRLSGASDHRLIGRYRPAPPGTTDALPVARDVELVHATRRR